MGLPRLSRCRRGHQPACRRRRLAAYRRHCPDPSLGQRRDRRSSQGGEWISSTELESHLARQPAVAEAAVIAVADETWGERPLAILVATAGEEIDLDAVRSGLAREVARWWMPERIEILGELPKTSVGKVDKQRLRERYARGD